MVEVEGGIDEKDIDDMIGKRLKILGNEKMKIAFWEIIHAINKVLPKISEKGSRELLMIYESLTELAKTKRINELRKEIDKQTVKFDFKVREEFVAG